MPEVYLFHFVRITLLMTLFITWGCIFNIHHHTKELPLQMTFFMLTQLMKNRFKSHLSIISILKLNLIHLERPPSQK